MMIREEGLKLAEKMRNLAAEYRKDDAKKKQEKTVKCAQVLTVARGLSAFKKILAGG